MHVRASPRHTCAAGVEDVPATGP